MDHMDFNYPNILDLFPQYRDSNRSESASFLMWYLENYYRLDSVETVDCVCDQRGDKGIDGIYVNNDTQTIVVFQSKISQRNTTVGDVSLKEFAGSLSQFKDADSVRKLAASAGRAQVAALIKRLEITDKIDEYELRAEFLSNIDLDANGDAFLEQAPEMSFVGRKVLETAYISDRRDAPIRAPISFDISGASCKTLIQRRE